MWGTSHVDVRLFFFSSLVFFIFRIVYLISYGGLKSCHMSF